MTEQAEQAFQTAFQTYRNKRVHGKPAVHWGRLQSMSGTQCRRKTTTRSTEGCNTQNWVASGTAETNKNCFFSVNFKVRLATVKLYIFWCKIIYFLPLCKRPQMQFFSRRIVLLHNLKKKISTNLFCQFLLSKNFFLCMQNAIKKL